MLPAAPCRTGPATCLRHSNEQYCAASTGFQLVGCLVAQAACERPLQEPNPAQDSRSLGKYLSPGIIAVLCAACMALCILPTSSPRLDSLLELCTYAGCALCPACSAMRPCLIAALTMHMMPFHAYDASCLLQDRPATHASLDATPCYMGRGPPKLPHHAWTVAVQASCLWVWTCRVAATVHDKC